MSPLHICLVSFAVVSPKFFLVETKDGSGEEQLDKFLESEETHDKLVGGAGDYGNDARLPRTAAVTLGEENPEKIPTSKQHTEVHLMCFMC